MAGANVYESAGGELGVGHIKGFWRELGRLVGTRSIGLRRIEVAADHFSTPAHEHGSEEEIFFVLGGEGVLWQDGRTWTVAAGDCVVHRPQRGVHTLRAGADGLDVLVFGERCDAALTALPRAGVVWSGARWLELASGEMPFAREAAAGPPDCPDPESERPPNLVGLDAVEAGRGGRVRALARAAGARATGLNHVVLAADESGAPAHCHSLEEELFVVLDGDGALELWPRGGGTPEPRPLDRGDVVSCLPGTGVAHALRAGPEGMTYLAYGTRETSDMCFYPESGRVSLRGLGIALRSPEIDHLPSA